jgi:hypothetical protein
VNASKEILAALVAGGMDALDAAALLARSALEMAPNFAPKSTGALRQQRYRERNKTSQSVTQGDKEGASQSVTNRNEGVTGDAASLSKEVKKESNKREKRGSQLPDDWRPEPKQWDEAIAILGSVDLAEKELRKFKLHAADKGRLAKNWNAAWVKWSLQAVEYGARNGHGTSNHRANPAAGRATTREADFVTSVAKGALQFLHRGEPAGTGREAPDGGGPAEVIDLGKRAENAR